MTCPFVLAMQVIKIYMRTRTFLAYVGTKMPNITYVWYVIIKESQKLSHFETYMVGFGDLMV